MKLWLLKRGPNDPAYYNEYDGFVVSAEDENSARELVLARFHIGSRERNIWADSMKTECKQIGISIVPVGIILDSNLGA